MNTALVVWSMGEGDEDEIFLSLEDEEPNATQPAAKPTPQPIVIAEAAEEVMEVDVVDSTVLSDAAGSYAVSWPILGMDCPCLLYTSPSPRDRSISRMPSSA